MSANEKYDAINPELSEWLRRLVVIRQENIHLKNQLADVVAKIIDLSKLDGIEDMQNRLLNKDIIIDLIRQDIAHQRTFFKENEQLTDSDESLFMARQKKLAKDIKKLEVEFYQLKNQFAKFLEQLIN